MPTNLGAPQTGEPWLLLIHQIPPKPDYLRVKIGRRLQRIGAVPVKNSVYLLPTSDQAREDFQWVRSEILDGGGEAFICRAEFVDGLTPDQVREMFRVARAADYSEVGSSARRLIERLDEEDAESDAERARAEIELGRLRKRFNSVAEIDFFDSPARIEAQRVLDAVEIRIRPPNEADFAELSRENYRARTWVTREGIFVDRIASAWLIARFIDPEARFKFVAPQGYMPRAGEQRFDMFDAEFTHVGARCTFETLLARFGLDDPALRTLAELVHDIDLKDAKYERPDAAGIEQVLAAIASAYPDDTARLQRGRQLFDELYALYASEVASSPSVSPGLPKNRERADDSVTLPASSRSP